MTTDSILKVGTFRWFEGQMWEVIELASNGVLLSDGSTIRRVGLRHLLERSAVPDMTNADAVNRDPFAVALSQLPKKTLDELHELENHLLEVIQAGESLNRAGYGKALKVKSAELGVSVRTLQRRLTQYDSQGLSGLIDSRATGTYDSKVDPRWDEACLLVLKDLTYASTPTRNVVLARIGHALDDRYGPGVVEVPAPTTARRRLRELSKGRHAFGSGKNRRSVAERPEGVYGRLHPTHPGEYVLLDTTRLDVFAMEPVTLRWLPVELTIAIDLYSRCIIGLRLSPCSTNSQDVAEVLFQAVSPPAEEAGRADYPYHGVPEHVVIQRNGGAGLPGCVPETLIVDHGKPYISDHIAGACARLGINIQHAIPLKPTDKPAVERFFRTLGQGFLQHLPAYKGPDVYSRGKDIEGQAYLFVAELEQLIHEWAATVYNKSKHTGIRVPELPGVSLSPSEMLHAGIARCGTLRLPASADLAFEFLAVQWRTIQHYGVEIKGQRYNGAILNRYRGATSPYRGRNAGKWPFFINSHDVRFAYFRDPDANEWHVLEWEHAGALGAPFSQNAAEYVRDLCLKEDRFVDPQTAVRDLLQQWSKDEIEARRKRSTARRISAQRVGSPSTPGYEEVSEPDARLAASYPGVIDLLGRREAKDPEKNAGSLPGEEDGEGLDVFEKYYRDHPEGGLEFME